ncbi:hypothetical protein ElyMa_004320500 [Elysia marginata]|uniref:Uncharacterized protein n=1 Tax=Elysia marginata TaxID=1093978 RepID=A0AAV4H078_9GAST|nr:hypothetical protein ElyMa_004320500 [Elysia marginata]
MAKVIPLVNILKQMVSCNDSPWLYTCINSCKNRSKPFTQGHTMAIALDPRFKRDGFPDTSASDSAVHKLKEKASALILPQSFMAQEEKDAKEETVTTRAKKPSLL